MGGRETNEERDIEEKEENGKEVCDEVRVVDEMRERGK